MQPDKAAARLTMQLLGYSAALMQAGVLAGPATGLEQHLSSSAAHGPSCGDFSLLPQQAGPVLESEARTLHAYRLPAVSWALMYCGMGPGASDSPEGASTILRTVEVYGACVSAGAGAKPRTTVPAGQSSTCDGWAW